MSWDVNTLRSLATLLGFVAFMVLVWRTWRRSSQPEHERAAALPFLHEESDEGARRE